jgi:hypothetical protein
MKRSPWSDVHTNWWTLRSAMSLASLRVKRIRSPSLAAPAIAKLYPIDGERFDDPTPLGGYDRVLKRVGRTPCHQSPIARRVPEQGPPRRVSLSASDRIRL